jgi:outer membrane protein assembly factor BamB
MRNAAVMVVATAVAAALAWAAGTAWGAAPATVPAEQQANWPRFRGADGTGVSDATTVPATWTHKDYNWTVALPGEGHSSPVVWGDRVYATCGDKATALRTVVCLAAGDGRELWRRDYRSKAFQQHGDNSYASATPACDGGGVVVTWSTPQEVVLLALDAEGREAWRRDLGPFVGIHGAGSSPIIVGDLVVLADEQEDPKALPSVYTGPNAPKEAGRSFLIAVGRRTGQTRWQVPRKSSQAAYSTPCLRRGGGDAAGVADTGAELIFSSTSHGLTAVRPADGAVVWELPNAFSQRCVGSPVAGEGLVLAGNGYGSRGLQIVAVRPGPPPVSAASASPGPSSQKAGPTAPATRPAQPAPPAEPAVAYKIDKPVPLVPTPLVKDGRLFLWGDEGTVACHKLATGELLWRQNVGGSFYGSPVWVAGRVYCIARSGEVYVLAAADKYALLAKVPLGEASQATPAVAGGVMYLRTLKHLFSLGGGGGKGPR